MFDVYHQVAVEIYYARCVNDWCSASAYASTQQDPTAFKREVNEAVCQALDTYSQLCTTRLVTFTWRTPKLCRKMSFLCNNVCNRPQPSGMINVCD